jgi:ribosome-associated heat shock protein Hsp15
MSGGRPHKLQAEPAASTQRLDKWLWFARVVKTRALAAQLVQGGKVRVNRIRAVKSSHAVRPGDVLTIVVSGRVRLLRVLELSSRRGPPTAARLLYEVLAAEPAASVEPD